MLQQTVNGLAIGSVYALIAIGYAVAFGVLRIVNLAYGETVMMGAFTGLLVCERLSPNLLLALFAGIVGAVITGLSIHIIAVRPLGDVSDAKSAAHLGPLVTTIGAAILLQNLALKLFGAADRTYPHLVSTRYVTIGTVSLSAAQGVLITLAFVLLGTVWFVLASTKWGLAVRAMAEKRMVAAALGIPVRKIELQVVCLASALAGISGVLVGVLDRGITPQMGVNYGLKGLCALIVGGLDSVVGAVIAALLLGLSEVVAVAYLSDTYRDAFAFGALLLTVLLRPQGLFGKTTLRY